MSSQGNPQAGDFHILSFSGGGYLGLFTAIVPAELAADAISKSLVSAESFLGHHAAGAPFYLGANAGDEVKVH